MDEQRMVRPTHLILEDMLIQALRFKHQSLNALAIEFFGRIGTDAVPRLLLEASSRKNGPTHRVRVLQAIARIGAVSDPLDLMTLALLLLDQSAEVRSAADLALKQIHHRS